jgi:hypothetical protein
MKIFKTLLCLAALGACGNDYSIWQSQFTLTGKHDNGQKFDTAGTVTCQRSSGASGEEFHLASDEQFSMKFDLVFTAMSGGSTSDNAQIETLSLDTTEVRLSASAFDLELCSADVRQVTGGHRLDVECETLIDENGVTYSDLKLEVECSESDYAI